MKKILFLFLILIFLSGCFNNNWHHKKPYYLFGYIDNQENISYLMRLKENEIKKETYQDLEIYDKDHEFKKLDNFYFIQGPFPALKTYNYWNVYIYNYEYNDKKGWELIKTEIKSKKEAQKFAKDIENSIGFKTKIEYIKLY